MFLTLLRAHGPRQAQLEAGLMAEPTAENVALLLVPIAVTAAMQTTMLRATITAYSTAVGPSSFLTKVTTFLMSLFMISPGLIERCRGLGVRCQPDWAVVTTSFPLFRLHQGFRSRIATVQTEQPDFVIFSALLMSPYNHDSAIATCNTQGTSP